MVNIKRFLVVLFISVIGFSCKKLDSKTQIENTEITNQNIDFTGNYVSTSYADRNEGYDWVSVAVSKIGVDTEKLRISVRSRADKKKPTCTFDAIIIKKDDKTYQTKINEKIIVFVFTKDSIKITPENESDIGLLYFYCSGGVTIAGTYTKINEPIDEQQVDKTILK